MRQASIPLVRKKLPSLKSALVLFIAAVVAVASSADADAARKKAAPAANPRYAAIVVDANTGKTLFSANADASRYPASLTKMMTLYLTFEALQRGLVKKSSAVPFSAHAAAQPPTKLGVKAGKSVTVETVIYSLVTKSANDAAAAMGELLGGSEAGFARMMTLKARQLGMNSTVFRNASGLPNTAQHTTARDMAILGIALREHFPQYYAYFSTRSFTYGRQRMGNHNRLLGRVKGIDGIKTGYTRASGFNLVSSVTDGDRRIVAVVMGGTSGGARDRHMAELIKAHLPKASTRPGGALVAKAKQSPAAAIASAILPKKKVAKPEPRPVATLEIAAAEPEPALKPARRKPAKAPAPLAAVVAEHGYAEPIPARMADLDPTPTGSIPQGWAVQVASSPSEVEARAFLAKTNKEAGTLLADASAYTVAFDKDGAIYYRARFGGFGSKDAAWKACNALKKRKIACYAVQQ